MRRASAGATARADDRSGSGVRALVPLLALTTAAAAVVCAVFWRGCFKILIAGEGGRRAARAGVVAGQRCDEGSAAPQDGRLPRTATRAAANELPVGAPATDGDESPRRARRCGRRAAGRRGRRTAPRRRIQCAAGRASTDWPRAAAAELPVGAPATDRCAARAGVVAGQRREAEARTAFVQSASVNAVPKAWARSEAARREQEQRHRQRHGSTTSWSDGAAMRRHRRRASPSARSWHTFFCN